MFGPKELDIRNTYNPNLNDIEESARRTFGEANAFFRKEELYLMDVAKRIKNKELISEEDIYDECHAIASDLAKCCEMYLKAIYIFEHNIPGNKIDLIWNKLKNSEFQTDINGNLIYQTPAGIMTFPKYNSNGEIERDSNGKVIYIDNQGNVYSENNRGKKIKISGHQLDRLIELLSPESRLLLETRLLTISMDVTEKNKSVSILDLLQNKGILDIKRHYSEEEYSSWIEQHKKTFEEARYSGEKTTSVNVEFLYHLATQLKAVAQYKIEPHKEQKFTITDEELLKLPNEIKQLVTINKKLLSEALIKLITSDITIKDKIVAIISQNYITYLNGITSNNFYQLVEKFDLNEISYLSYLCYIIENLDQFDKKINNSNIEDNIKNILMIANVFKRYQFNINQLIEFCIQVKLILNEKINNKLFLELFGMIGIKEISLNKLLYNPKNINHYVLNNDELKKYYDNINNSKLF